MGLTTDGMSPADLAAVTGNNNNGAFGDGNGAWDTSGRYSRGRYPDMDYGDYSNARRGQHYVRGHYSYNDAKMQVKETIKDMMHDSNLSSTDQAALGRALAELDR